MKLLITIIGLSLATGIVACSKKSGGGGNTQVTPVPYNHNYPGNDLYVGPGPQDPNFPVPNIPNIPGCSTPPPIFIDIYQECAWLATTTDCDSNYVDQMFINKCYGLNLTRPGCVFPEQPVLVSCGVSCYSDDDYDDYEPRRRTRVREERRVERRESTRVTRVESRDQVSVIREPVRETVREESRKVREVVVHPQPSPSRVVIADRTTGPDNTRGVSKECQGNVVRDCRYRRPIDGIRGSVQRAGARARHIIASDLEVRRGQNQSESRFYKQVERGNVECKHDSTGNRYSLSYFDYAKAIDEACFGKTVVVTPVAPQNPIPSVTHVQAIAEVPAPAVPEGLTRGGGPVSAPVVTQPVAEQAKAKFDSSKCQWIVQIHNNLKGGAKNISSYSRQYTVQPTSDIATVDNASLAEAMCVVGHGRQTYVAANADQEANMSAIGFDVRIEDDKLLINNQAEIIKVCSEDEIVTQFISGQQGQHFVTKKYIWNRLNDNDGQIDVASDIAVNAYGDAVKMNFVTRRLVIWKSGLIEQKTFTQDARILDRTSNQRGTEGYNSAELSKRTNLTRANGKPICEDRSPIL